VGHLLRRWHTRTSRDRLDIELHSGVVDERDPRSLSLLEDLLWEAFRESGSDAEDTVLRIYRAITGSSAQLDDSFEREREVGDQLRAAARRGHLRVSGLPVTPTTPVRLGDELMNPLADVSVEEPPTPPTTWFSIVVVDEVGDPIADVNLELEILGESMKLNTDGSGRARVDGMEGGSALVSVTSPSRLRDTLKPRWATPRTPVIAESTAEAPVHIERLDDHFDPIRLSREIEATLVILPRFSCREIAATTFDFGRSFVRREGISRLATIAEELQQDDGQLAWIFGHTDASGGELLNKRLSERRAKAIFALFTHDFAKWDEMWRGSVKETPWSERWGTREMQHVLNSLSCGDDAGSPLDEDGDLGAKTNQAVRRFKRKDYPTVPAEQADLPDNTVVDTDTRRELFFAYAKLIGRVPVATDRIAPIGAAPFMGCGEFNALSTEAKDRESRRSVVFVFDPAAQPQNPPCTLADVAPCRANLVDPPPDPEGPPPYYRCSFYKSIATCCPAAGGADLAHDVIVRFFMTVKDANALPHKFILEAEDMPDDDDTTPPFRQEFTLQSDVRAVEPDSTESTMVELQFTHVPDAAKYRLRVEGVATPYTVFARRPFHMISELSQALDVVRMPRLWSIRNPPPAPPDDPEAR
jgi:outer membrane protein OmpA-like peptidoglycan-associated protein